MLARFAQFAVVVLALVIGSRVEAGPIIYGTYYDETVFAVGCSGSVCRLNFSQLPSDKLLLVNNINCQFVANAQAVSFILGISATSGGAPFGRALLLPFPPVALINSYYTTTFSENTQWLIGQGRFPYVQGTFAAGLSGQMTCTLIGNLVTPIT
jgi:hypothetical protein